MKGTGEQLFDFIAECVKDFAAKQLENTPISNIVLGFTFSFPGISLS